VRACFMLARVHTPSSLVRERERDEGKRERGRERKREREKEGGGGKRERERGRICPELLFLLFKGMTGALAPFSYLVIKNCHTIRWSLLLKNYSQKRQTQ
jgi:hypothetical protein